MGPPKAFPLNQLSDLSGSFSEELFLWGLRNPGEFKLADKDVRNSYFTCRALSSYRIETLVSIRSALVRYVGSVLPSSVAHTDDLADVLDIYYPCDSSYTYLRFRTWMQCHLLLNLIFVTRK